MLQIKRLFVVATLMIALVSGTSTRLADCNKCSLRRHPMCGEDGKTYINYCRMICKKVKLSDRGPCSPSVSRYHSPIADMTRVIMFARRRRLARRACSNT